MVRHARPSPAPARGAEEGAFARWSGRSGLVDDLGGFDALHIPEVCHSGREIRLMPLRFADRYLLMITTAKVFANGRSQAIRLPKEFRVSGKEVRITRV